MSVQRVSSVQAFEELDAQAHAEKSEVLFGLAFPCSPRMLSADVHEALGIHGVGP